MYKKVNCILKLDNSKSIKIGGIYYFTWSCDDTGSENYHVN